MLKVCLFLYFLFLLKYENNDPWRNEIVKDCESGW